MCFVFCAVFSRIPVNPFNRVAPKQDMGTSMAFQSEKKPLMERAIESASIILELRAAFASMQEESTFQEVLALNNELCDLDMKVQFNYSLFLFQLQRYFTSFQPRYDCPISNFLMPIYIHTINCQL